MTGFSSEWLGLREGLDAASRAAQFIESLNKRWPDRPASVTDLASGTGANLRYLAPMLGGSQLWTLVDNDQALMDAMPARMQAWAGKRGINVKPGQAEFVVTGPDFECHARALSRDLAAEPDGFEFPLGGLVTASALLDLVSGSWLETLAKRCSLARAPGLFALTYDGLLRFDPEEPEDERVRELVNVHQTTDKGFGPALGPAAASETRRRFEALGYTVDVERSDWRVTADATALQEALLTGWQTAAVEIAPKEEERLSRWLQRRRAHVAGGCSALTVGHVDLLAWPPE